MPRKKLTFAGVPFVVKALAFAGVPFVVKALAFAASRSTDNVEVRSSPWRICLMLEKLLAGESLPGVLEMKAGASLRAIGPYTTYRCLEES